MPFGFDKGVEERTVLTVFCPQCGPSLRTQFVNRVLAEHGYDVLTKPVTPEICGSNPVHVIVDDWPRIKELRTTALRTKLPFAPIRRLAVLLTLIGNPTVV